MAPKVTKQDPIEPQNPAPSGQETSERPHKALADRLLASRGTDRREETRAAKAIREEYLAKGEKPPRIVDLTKSYYPQTSPSGRTRG